MKEDQAEAEWVGKTDFRVPLNPSAMSEFKVGITLLGNNLEIKSKLTPSKPISNNLRHCFGIF
jgi:hypothetical protein